MRTLILIAVLSVTARPDARFAEVFPPDTFEYRPDWTGTKVQYTTSVDPHSCTVTLDVEVSSDIFLYGIGLQAPLNTKLLRRWETVDTKCETGSTFWLCDVETIHDWWDADLDGVEDRDSSRTVNKHVRRRTHHMRFSWRPELAQGGPYVGVGMLTLTSFTKLSPGYEYVAGRPTPRWAGATGVVMVPSPFVGGDQSREVDEINRVLGKCAPRPALPND